MGYVRAHLGRVVEDANGNEGFSIVIHSTVPGATSRNFCVWLDNGKGQAEYKPQYLIGHGGRFRNYYCAPPEISGENMHPAPMPIDKNGKPFAPITTLREYVALDEASDEFFTNLHLVLEQTSTRRLAAKRVRTQEQLPGGHQTLALWSHLRTVVKNTQYAKDYKLEVALMEGLILVAL